MLTPGGGSRIYLALRPVDMRKGFDGLTAQVAQVLQEDPFGGQLFLFRSRRGDRLKAVWWDGTGHPRAYAACGHGPLDLFAKRVERGSFVWPVVKEGAITLTSAQLAMLIEGLDWRRAVLMTETVKPVAT
jgi:transposase